LFLRPVSRYNFRKEKKMGSQGLGWPFKVLAFCCVLVLSGRAVLAADDAAVRIGLTPVFLDDQTAFVNAWRIYLEQRLARPVTFVQRARYREINDLLRAGKLDFAWVCGYPYVSNRDAMTLLAVPIYQGQPTYRSYLIVPAPDRATNSIVDLRGKIFAFSDRDSNSGYLSPVYELSQLKQTPNAFFARTFFTGSHRAVVQAVAHGVADGGAVDGYVWEILALQHPELTAETRVVQKSREYGFPPFVASKAVTAEDAKAMQRTLIGMSGNADGIELLRRLHLDGFIAGEDRMFDTIAAMMPAARER
jgi:phosphonate transport system substrate-binding protein